MKAINKTNDLLWEKKITADYIDQCLSEEIVIEVALDELLFCKTKNMKVNSYTIKETMFHPRRLQLELNEDIIIYYDNIKVTEEGGLELSGKNEGVVTYIYMNAVDKDFEENFNTDLITDSMYLINNIHCDICPVYSHRVAYSCEDYGCPLLVTSHILEKLNKKNVAFQTD